jgi:hypothetical protein
VSRPPARLAIIAGAWLALFALLFSVGSALGLWPPPPVGGFRGTDLIAGFVFGALVLVMLVRGRS